VPTVSRTPHRFVALILIAVALFGVWPSMAVAGDTDGCSDIDRLTLRGYVLDGEYASAEEMLACLEGRFFEGETTDEPVWHAYGAFATSDPELEERLEAWVEARPDSHRPRMARARYWIAIAWLERGAALAGETSDEQFAAMKRYMGKARDDLRTVIDRQPGLTVAYAALIDMVKATGSVDKVQQIARSGLDQYEASYPIRYELLYALQPKWGGSIEGMRNVIHRTERLLDENPRLARLHGFLAYVKADELDRAGQHERARKYYDKAIERGGVVRFFEARAETYEDLERYDAAEADHRKVLELAPETAESYVEMGDFVRLYRDQSKSALRYYDRAIDYSPLDPDAREGRGYAHAELGHYGRALEDLQRATVYDDHDADLHQYVGWLAMWKLDRPAEAIPHAERAYELGRDNSDNLQTLTAAKNAEQDCSVVADMEAYLQACERDGDCDDDYRVWVEQTLPKLRSHCG